MATSGGGPSRPTKYVIQGAHYDTVQGIRESAYEIAKVYNRAEELKIEVAAKDLKLLPSARKVTEAEQKALEHSAIAKEYSKRRDEQSKQFSDLRQDLNQWRARASRSGADALNSSARDLVRLSATAAIELLIENSNLLTQEHFANLGRLGVNVPLDRPSPLLTQETLLERYEEADLKSLMGEKDNLTALEVWDLLITRMNSAIESANKHKEASKKVQESLKKVQKEFEGAQGAWDGEKKGLEKEIQEVKSKLSDQEAHLVIREKEFASEKKSLKLELEAAHESVEAYKQTAETHRKTRAEVAQELELAVNAALSSGATAVNQGILEQERLEFEIKKLEARLSTSEDRCKRLKAKNDSQKAELNSLGGVSSELSIVRREAENLKTDKQKLSKKLKQAEDNERLHTTQLTAYKESRDRNVKRLTEANQRCDGLQSNLQSAKDKSQELRNQLDAMGIYQTYIEYIGQQLEGTPQKPLDVAEAVLSKIQELQSQEVSMTDETIQTLQSEIENMKKDAFKHVEERGKLSGQFENEQANHRITKQDFKAERKAAVREASLLNDEIRSKTAQIQEIERQIHDVSAARDEYQSQVDDLNVQVSNLEALNRSMEKIITDKDNKLDDVDEAVFEATQKLEADLASLTLQRDNLDRAKQELQTELDNLKGRVDGFIREARVQQDIVDASLRVLGPGEGGLEARLKSLVANYNSTSTSLQEQESSCRQKLAAKDEELETKLATKDQELEEKLAAKDQDLKNKLATKDEELKNQIATKDSESESKLQEKQLALNGKATELDNATNRITSLEGDLSTAKSSLEHFKTTLRLDVSASDEAVQATLSGLQGYESTVTAARAKLSINQSNGDVLAAIEKLADDLSTAQSTAATAVTAQGSKEALQGVIDTIKTHLGRTMPNADVPQAIKDLLDQLGIAQGDQTIVQQVRLSLGVSAHRDLNDFVVEMKQRNDKLTPIVNDARRHLGQEDVVGGISGLITRVTAAESIVNRARIQLSIDLQVGDVNAAIITLKQNSSRADRCVTLVRTTFGFAPVLSFEDAVRDTKTRLDNAENTAKAVRTSLQLPLTGDVKQALTGLVERLAKCETLRKSAAETLGVPEDALLDELSKLQGRVTLVIKTFHLCDCFDEGIASIQSRLLAARRSLNLGDVDGTDIATGIDSLQRQLQARDSDLSHVRTTLSISGALRQGVNSVKQRLDSAELTIKDARIPLGLVDGDNKLRSAIETTQSNARNVQDELTKREKEVSDAKSLLKLSGTTTLQDGLVSLQSACKSAEDIIKDARNSLELAHPNVDLVEALDELKSEAKENKDGREASEKEVSDARSLLQLSDDTTLQNGLVALQGAFNSTRDIVKDARSSLKLADPSADLVQAIDKLKSAAEENKNGRDASEKEVSDAKSLLKLSGTTSLQEGLVNLQTALTAAEDIIKDARASLELTDPSLKLVASIGQVKSEAQTKTAELETVQGQLEEALSTITNAQKALDLQDSNSPISPAIKSLKEQLHGVQSTLAERQKEVDDARGLLKLSTTTTLQKGLEDLQKQLTDAEAILRTAQNTLGLPVADLNISHAISNVQNQLSNAKNELSNVKSELGDVKDEHTRKSQVIDDARKYLNLSVAVTLQDGLVAQQNALTQAQQSINNARNFLDLGDAVSLMTGLAAQQKALTDAQAINNAARESLNLNAGDSLQDGLAAQQEALRKARDSIENTRNLLQLRNPNSDIGRGIEVLKRDHDVYLVYLADCTQSIRRLIVPGKDLNTSLPAITTEELARFKTMSLDVGGGKNDPLPAEKFNWSLEVAETPATREPFDQLTQRLKVMMIFDADVPDRLQVLEDLIIQVQQCTLADLNVLFNTLYACWICSKHIHVEDKVITPIEGPKQSSLQVLFEARLLELLIRGTSVLRCGWSSLDDAMQLFWGNVNRPVIDDNLMLRAYDAWFKSLDQPSMEILSYYLAEVVGDSDPSLICTDKTDGSRHLFASVMADGSYCFLVKSGQTRASLFPVSDLQYHLPKSVTVFPNRNRGDAGVSTDPAFEEPLSSRFVETQMTSLYNRGSTARYQAH